jgi:hypothetical protein
MRINHQTMSARNHMVGKRRIATPAQLRKAIAKLPPSHPITDQFSAKWRRLGNEHAQERQGVWYRTQHEHWLGWLRGYDGPGAYNRKDPVRTAEFVYSHVVNPQMLVYLGEALGIDRALLAKATSAALKNATTMSAMSATIRRVLPWHMMEPALRTGMATTPAHHRGDETPSRRAARSKR